MLEQVAIGAILTLSWPDVYVSGTEEKYNRLLTKVGLNKNGMYKAGHSALVLIDCSTGSTAFHDFGRYITPLGKGRVRGALTDPEVTLPLKGIFDKKGKLENIEEILLYLGANDSITHGHGRLIASINYQVDYFKAKEFIVDLQSQGSVAYSPFHPKASNCSRFVADTLKNSLIKKWDKLKNAYRITVTPSPLGNVLNASTEGILYKVEQGKFQAFKANRGMVLKDILGGFLQEPPKDIYQGTSPLIEPQRPQDLTSNAQWLGGIGAGAWFQFQNSTTVEKDIFLIQRISPTGTVDFTHSYRTEHPFDEQLPYRFVYDSNAHFCTLEQNGKRLRMNCVKRN